MKIGITADVHLRGKRETPERFNALKDILNQLKDKGISHLIIAGDLFDKNTFNYSDFDNLCKEYNNIKFYIIPGNHDPELRKKDFSANNIYVFAEPNIYQFPEYKFIKFLFIPYSDERSMGEIIEEKKSELTPNKWILIGHGDYYSNRKLSENVYEKGVYMPLYKIDEAKYQPAKIILGHIHKPTNIDKLYYPGSPFPLDISETGKRRCLILDMDTLALTSSFINTDVIYFNEVLTIIPWEDEAQYIKEEAKKIINKWEISDEEKKKVKMRIKVQGAVSSKDGLSEMVSDAFNGIEFYDEPDINEVDVIEENSAERISILNRVKEEVENLKWEKETPTKDEILVEAIKTIWGLR